MTDLRERKFFLDMEGEFLLNFNREIISTADDVLVISGGLFYLTSAYTKLCWRWPNGFEITRKIDNLDMGNTGFTGEFTD